MIKKIAVALDGSEAADKALDFALDFADRYRSEIVLVSVIPPSYDYFYALARARSGSQIEEDEYVKGLTDYHKRVLSSALKIAKKVKPNLKISTKLLEGPPSDAIVQYVREEKCGMVILGGRGLGWRASMKELFLGSVSHRVADRAPCPVLIVK